MGKQSRAKKRAAEEAAAPPQPAVPETPPLPSWIPWTVALGLALVAFAAFIPSLDGRFLNWDDEWNFVNNYDFGPISNPRSVTWMWTNLRGHWMPLTWMTLALDCELYGKTDLAGWHVTSMLFHAANAPLFFAVLLLLFRAAFPHGDPLRLLIAATGGALLFALHPLRAESVAWLTERRDVVSGNFFLISVLAYLVLQHASGARRHILLAVSVLLFAFSLASKAMGMALPLVLLAVDVYPLRRRFNDPRVWLEKIPYLLLMAGSIVLTRYAQTHVGAMDQKYAFQDMLLQPGFRTCFYVWKFLVPLWLSPLYLFQHFRHVGGGRVALYVVCTLIAVSITAGLWLLRRRWPAGVTTWFCYGVLIGPVIGIFQAGPHFAADRYTYLACLPFTALAAAGLVRLRPKTAVAVAVPILVGLAVLTWRQCGIWNNSIALWTHAIACSPEGNNVAYNNRGVPRMAQKDAEGALEDFNHALRIKPNYVAALNNRGDLLRTMGRFKEAIRDFDRAVERDPDYAEGFSNRGLAKADMGDARGALADFEKAIELDPAYSKAYTNRGVLRARSGDAKGAIQDFTQAIKINPFSVEAHSNRGAMRAGQGDLEGALRDYARALELNPNHVEAYTNRAGALAAMKRYDEAIADCTRAIALNPKSADAYSNRGAARAGKQDYAGAEADYTKALGLNPQHLDARANRGISRERLGRRADALRDYEQVLRAAPATWRRRASIQSLVNRLKGR